MSGAVPPPAARPLERAAWVPRPVCPGCGGCGRVDPAPAPQRAPLRSGVARCGGCGGASPGGVPSTAVRGAWCQALSLPRPPVLWSGQPGFRNPCVPGAVDAGVWTPHRPHGVRPCGTALLAVGVAEGRPRGGVPSTVVRGAWCQALSLPRPPVLWSGLPGFRCACVFVCVLCLAGSGGPASRARSGAPHLFLWPLCLSALLGPLRAGVVPLSLAAVAVPRCPGALFFFFFFLRLPLPGSPCARAWFVSPAWPLAARWWLLPSPPPPLCPAVFVAPAWCLPRSSFSVRPRCLRLSLVSGPGCPRPRRLRCLLCWPAASRLSVRLSLFCAFRLAVGCSLVVAAPPPPLCFSRFSSLPLGAVCRVVLCVPGCGAAPRCCALCRPVLCCRALCCAPVVPLLVAPCPLALPIALGPCALRRCVLRCSPALCALCCVCFVVARWCVLLFAALLCAVCVPGCCAVRSLCSPLCAVLCFAVLVRSRCAVRVVRAVAGAWRCGALLCVVLFPVVCRGAVLGLLARGCLLVACFGVGVPVWPRGLLPCGWCGLLWCPAFLCRVLWCCAVAWCCAVVLCCRFAVLLGLALPFCGLSCCAVLCCWLAVLFFARWWCLRAVVLFSSCRAFPVFSPLCAAVPCCAVKKDLPGPAPAVPLPPVTPADLLRINDCIPQFPGSKSKNIENKILLQP